LAIDWVYIFGYQPIRCAYQEDHVLSIIVTGCFLVFSCIFFVVLIRSKTRTTSTIHHQSQQQDPITNSPVVDQNNDQIHHHLTINAVQEALALIEEKASARRFANGFILLFALTISTVLTSIPAVVCVQFYRPDDVQCSALFSLATYDDKIVSLQALISPLLIIFRDQRLVNWLKRFFCHQLNYRRSFPKRLSNFLSTIV
jgi:hypothetical protein